MPLPAYVDDLDALPEAVRAYYVETEDGRWRLDAEGVEDVSGLKSALEKERAERKALKAELAARDGEDEESVEPDPVPEPEPVPELEASEPDRAAALEARLLEAEARAAIQAAHGVPELLLSLVTSRLSMAEDGSIAAAMEDGTTQSTAELVEMLRADPVYGRAFDATGKGGSGAPVAGRGDAGPVTVSASDPRAVARHIADIAAGRVRLA